MTSTIRDMERKGYRSGHEYFDAEVGQALFGAIRRGDADRVQQLLQIHHTVVDQLDQDGKCPLTVSLEEGHGRVVEILLENGASHSYTDQRGDTPLHIVAGHGNYEALQAFLKIVTLPDMNKQNKDGDTAIMMPASRGFSIVVECLLLHNSNPNISNNTGRTPMMAAASKGNKEVMKVLLKFGADILLTSYEDYSGMPTALKEAVAHGSADITAFVTQHCNEATDRIKRLFICKTRDDVDSLLKSGCSVNHRRGDGTTALMVHAESGNVDVVLRLLEAHAFMDGQDKNGQTALMKCSFSGRVQVVEELVKNGALLDLRCTMGRTALMYGVLGESLEVTKYMVLSGADITITDNSGETAQGLARKDDIIYTFLKEKSTAQSTKPDPFLTKVSEYLQQQTQAVQRDSPSNSPSMQRRKELPSRPSARGDHMSSHSSDTANIGGGFDENEPLRQQLNTYIKRVAELETRIEELTIRAEFSVTDDEDLSHYITQPDRLIEEFKKVKMTKKKAEQFAIEAKQTAQKASVDLSRVKEELSLEKHSNELKMKHMVSDLEQMTMAKEQTLCIMEEKEATLRAMVKAVKDNSPPEEISKLEGKGMVNREYSPEDVFDLIVRGNKKIKFKVTLVAICGLPGSGKSTVVGNMVSKTKDVRTLASLRFFEVGYCATSRRNLKILTPEWDLFPRKNIHEYMLTRALVKDHNAIPILSEWSENCLPASRLKSHHLRNHFRNVYDTMRDGLQTFLADKESDYHFHIMSEPLYVFLNIWDIGFNKALNEALPLIARLIHPFVMLYVINIARDGGKNLRELPERRGVHEKQKIMQGRSRGHYCMRMSGLCKHHGRSFLIGTHKDKLPPGEIPKVKQLTEAGLRAKACDVGAAATLHSEMLIVDAKEQNGCECIKRSIEDFMSSTDKFDHDLQLNWMFLRTALLDYETESDFLIPRTEFDELARECGLRTKEEIEKCLKFFTQIGSLLSNEEFIGDNVIYRPYVFFDKLNALYEAVEKGDEHMKQSLRVGLLCKNVAEEIWKQDKDFFWVIMQEAGVATATLVEHGENTYDYKLRCPHAECDERKLLFISSLCNERLKRNEGMKEDSLFITFSTEYVPADIQAHFVKRIKKHIPEIKLKQSVHYNSTVFELPHGEIFQIIVHGDVVELLTQPTMLPIKSTLTSLCTEILDSVLEYFPGFEYQLGFLCKVCCDIHESDPPNNNTTSYLYFIPSQYETQLFCKRCKEMRQLTPGQKKWMEINDAAIRTVDGKCFEARVVEEAELTAVIRLIPLDCFEIICTKLSQTRIFPPYSEEKLVGVLMTWQQQSLCNRRQKLAQILLRLGCYRAAIKLDPKLYDASQAEIPYHLSLTDVEIEIICNCAVNWRQLATELNSQSIIKDIEQYMYTSERERCRAVLKTVNGPDSRKVVVTALVNMGWKTLAESLECGYTNKYSAHHLL